MWEKAGPGSQSPAEGYITLSRLGSLWAPGSSSVRVCSSWEQGSCTGQVPCGADSWRWELVCRGLFGIFPRVSAYRQKRRAIRQRVKYAHDAQWGSWLTPPGDLKLGWPSVLSQTGVNGPGLYPKHGPVMGCGCLGKGAWPLARPLSSGGSGSQREPPVTGWRDRTSSCWGSKSFGSPKATHQESTPIVIAQPGPISACDTHQGNTAIYQYTDGWFSMLCCVWLFVTPRAAVCQASLSMGFSKQEYWSGLPFLSPRKSPVPGIEPTSLASPALTGGFFTTAPPAWQLTIHSKTMTPLTSYDWLI